MSKIRWIVVLFVALVAVPLNSGDAQALPLFCDWRSNDTAVKIRECVTLFGVRGHQAVLQAIADLHGGDRAAGTPGNDASVAYVVGQLEAAGYAPTVQEFDYVSFEIVGASALQAQAAAEAPLVEGTDFAPMEQTDPGDVTAPITPVDLDLGAGNTSSSGCEPVDFAGFPAGNIALVQRGTCTVEKKAEAAAEAGASGVVLFNQGDTPDREGLPDLSLTTHNHAGIPVLAATYRLGVELARQLPLSLRLFANTQREETTTFNVLAETSAGNPDNVVMVGAHLDSDPGSPGINDNGSGDAALLEIAEAVAHTQVTNKIRFAWWGAEELGTVGSALYLTNLPQEEVDKIALYLNVDMIGSPNPARFVYDGDGSAFGTTAPAGSAAIEQFFTDYYADEGLPSEPTRIEFSSDYAIFFVKDVPFGGVFSGSTGIKTPEQAATYGGTAGEPYDPCNHSACDDFGNVDLSALAGNSDAVATATITYAMDTSSVTAASGGSSPAAPVPVVAPNAA